MPLYASVPLARHYVFALVACLTKSIEHFSAVATAVLLNGIYRAYKVFDLNCSNLALPDDLIMQAIENCYSADVGIPDAKHGKLSSVSSMKTKFYCF